MCRKTLVRLALAVLFVVAAGPLAAQDHANHARGFRADQVYQTGDLDHVNLFNGNLNLAIPIGQTYPVGGALAYGLTLTYSGNVWDVEERCDVTGCYTQHLANRDSNAGLGWLLKPGKLEWTGTAWVYHGPDGAEHTFAPTLHPNDPVTANVFYTRDGSYLRLNSATRKVELPDGTIHTFDTTGRLTRMEDRFGNYANVTYTGTSYAIADQHGRTQTVHLRAAVYYGQVVDRVVLTAFGGTTATYTFNYTDADVTRACGDNDPETGATERVPLLVGVTLPDGSTYSMPTTDYDTAGGTCPHHAGHIKGMTLPTKGRLEWDYQNYAFPTESGSKPLLQRSSGVAKRRTRNAAGTLLGEWIYTAELLPAVSTPTNPKRERVTTVTTPLGHKTVHYFSAYVSGGPIAGGWDYDEYGLPFTREANDGTAPARYLSSKVFKATDLVNPVRTTYVRYERDHPDGGQDSNRREVSSRTVYHDDGGRTADVNRSAFDGLGHYRLTATAGTFDSGNVRSEEVNYNPGTGNYTLDANGYPLPGYTMLAATAPWVLGVASWRQVVENGVTEHTGFCYDAATGFVRRKRTHKNSGSTENGNDVLAVYDHVAGNLTREQYYGGDNLAITANGTTCTMALGNDQYRLDHTYQYGALKTSQYKDLFGGAGGVLAFYAVNRTIDASTGLVAASADASGISTSYSYDTSGRLTLESPAAGEGGKTAYVYTPASGPGVLARVDIDRKNNAGTVALARSRVYFDALGRVWKEEQLMPSGAWSARETLYNGQGWKSSVSEQGTLSKKTIFGGYDPFGRPGTITAPDGKQVALAYAGARSLTRTVQVGTGRDGFGNVVESPAATTETYDRQGRLWRVSEPANPGGTNTTTTYAYDVGSRLKQVTQATAAGTQNRYFTYDNRGFLTSEQHPEKGSLGNGAVTYSKYNARGHAERVVDGPFDITFAYDRAERLVRETETPSGTILRDFTYGVAADGRGLGRLKTVKRLNFHAGLGWFVNVNETYTYGGKAGRVSRRDTVVEAPIVWSYTQSWTWNDLGLPETVTYPTCTHTGCTGVAPARTVSPAYTNGFTSSVPGFATAITYHPNGLVAQVSHANGANWVQGNDPNGMRRPSLISISTGGQLGPYSYDGAGNVTKVGGENYIYDKVSRVTQGALGADRQDYTFDGFGNLLSIATTPAGGGTTTRTIATVATTNRLSAAGYDAAGNLTSWGGYTYGYSAYNELRSVHGGGNNKYFSYTADGERIWEHDAAADRAVWRIRDLDGKVLREYVNNGGVWSWGKDYVYRDGQLLSTVSPTEGTRYVYADHLGTPRQIKDAFGGTVEGHHYYAFGEELAFSQTGEPMRFTGHERDYNVTTGTTDDLDYMHARHYSPHLGRFFSVDPKRRRAALKLPQLWNRYGYSAGNPLKFTDPNGEDIKIATGGDTAYIYSLLVKSVMRPTGRAVFGRFATTKTFTLTLKEGSLPPLTNQPGKTRTGRTTSHTQVIDGKAENIGADVQLDKAAITRFHRDKSGMTTFNHEGYHAMGYAGNFPNEVVKRGDLPSNETGPADAFGELVASEKPDLSEEEARRLVDAWLAIQAIQQSPIPY
jgi:RHS repeat-associated protein